MIFAQFYHLSAGYNQSKHDFSAPRELVEACGDRSVIILDARTKLSTMKVIAAHECRARKYLAYRIFKGERFETSNPLSDLIEVRAKGWELTG